MCYIADMMDNRNGKACGTGWGRWVIVAVILFGLILGPYVLYGEQINLWCEAWLSSSIATSPVTAGLIILLLCGDVLLPVPSALLSTASGMLFGLGPGCALSSIGMTLGSVGGYLLGRYGGRPMADRLVGRDELQRLERSRLRRSIWLLIVFRPIPVLAEASVVVAGLGGVNFARFAVMTTLANIGISFGYAAVGAWGVGTRGFLLAFVAALVFPGIAYLCSRRLRQAEAGSTDVNETNHAPTV